jgi:hypothetical protein
MCNIGNSRPATNIHEWLYALTSFAIRVAEEGALANKSLLRLGPVELVEDEFAYLG